MSDDLTTAVETELAALAAPLRGQIERLDVAIEERTVELEKLRASRSQARRALAMIDPSYVIPGKPGRPKGGPPKTTVAARVGEETVAAVEKRLHDNLPDVNGNGGFTITSLRRDYGFEDMSQSTLQKAVAVLHDRDLIRLDHRGRGGAHYFKVVA